MFPCCFSTLGKAWQSLKAELRYHSEAHSKFAEEVSFKVIIMDHGRVTVLCYQSMYYSNLYVDINTVVIGGNHRCPIFYYHINKKEGIFNVAMCA